MKLDASIVTNYLQGREDYAGHWLFTSIQEGEYTFDRPDPVCRKEVEALCCQAEKALYDFTPYNAALFAALFPRWRELAAEVNVLLAVGCPAPYDAMTMEREDGMYLVFDLIRFLDYQRAGKDIPSVLRALITHELTHVCLRADYQPVLTDYRGKLAYITFNEGFAHALAYAEDIMAEDFSAVLAAHYLDAVGELKAALAETEPQKQAEYLRRSDCGTYWGKFAAMSGKLYLLAHREEMEAIYRAGPAALLAQITQ